MGTTSTIHSLKRQDKLREKASLSFKVSPCHQHGNRASRKAKMAGKNPHHGKGGPDWRKKAELWGRRWPKRRTLGIVNPDAVEVTATGKKVPLHTDWYFELHPVKSARKPPQHTRDRQS